MEHKSRREFIKDSAKATLFTALGGSLLVDSLNAAAAAPPLVFSQLQLPYGYTSLEPYIDAQTMEIHYSKHHAAYVKNVNDAISAEGITATSMESFFGTTSTLSAKARNNGGGAWNHNFFWQVMKPAVTTSTPSGKLAEAINASFGSFDKMKEQFTQAALSRFGSGWAWLVVRDSKLQIGSTPNQDNPLMDVSDLKGAPLLALDVWEHAYYLKYQNKRNEYVANWWNVVNWDAVAAQLK